jgi:hypothetical protein
MLLENKDLVSPTTCPPTHKSVHEYFWADDSRVDRRIPLPSAAESLKELEHIKKARTTLLNRVDASCKETRLLVTFDGTVGECVLEAAEAAAAQEAAAAEKAAKEARDHALQATWAVVATSAELAKCNAKAELAAARAAFACACVAVLEKDGLVLDKEVSASGTVDSWNPNATPFVPSVLRKYSSAWPADTECYLPHFHMSCRQPSVDFLCLVPCWDVHAPSPSNRPGTPFPARFPMQFRKRACKRKPEGGQSGHVRQIMASKVGALRNIAKRGKQDRSIQMSRRKGLRQRGASKDKENSRPRTNGVPCHRPSPVKRNLSADFDQAVRAPLAGLNAAKANSTRRARAPLGRARGRSRAR